MQWQHHSWWQCIGETITNDAITVGGAIIHHTHTLVHFGNVLHRVVLCAQCGGMTHGAFSPLLSVPCRRHAGDTRQRQVSRVMLRQLWPTGALQQQYGTGTLSNTIRFREVAADRVQIVAAEDGGSRARRSATAGDPSSAAPGSSHAGAASKR